jgi:hypothetical protein
MGAEITRADGHDKAIKEHALYTQAAKLKLSKIGGITASATARIRTDGVYIFENRLINFSQAVFLATATRLISICL